MYPEEVTYKKRCWEGIQDALGEKSFRARQQLMQRSCGLRETAGKQA